ncbi:MAG TPA: hypothetical protein VEH27_18905 [Methylomirabilota bacterium]|nr:hypothetical protein [Methylomirabilota bacterium]
MAAQTEVIYSTGFEASEGFDRRFTLSDQGGWEGAGTGGNGLLPEAFEGLGQQAFIGFFPPLNTNNVDTTVWRPFGISPLASGYPVLKFNVKMQVLASTTGGKDEFRWSVYGTNNYRLLSIVFDTSTQEIWYITEDDDPKFVYTNYTFEHDGTYDLEIVLNYGRNTWSASLNGTTLVNSHPITATPSRNLTFSDIAAAWIVANPKAPGDNYMVFDNYSITGQLATQPRLQVTKYHPNGEFEFKILGEEGLWYEVQVTSNWVEWFSLGTYKAGVGGVIDFRDTTAPGNPRGYYTVASVPPPQ